MFQHGKLKERKIELTEKERLQIEEKLKTITIINKDILSKRRLDNLDERYNLKNLDYLIKAAKLMTDSTTIWNYRKELILYIKEKSIYNEDELYDLYKQEIKHLSSLLLSNPKSYVLWNHREWILLLSAEYEKSRELYSKSLLKNDILLCNQFLLKDNRNFHCWNYRLVLFLMVKTHFSDHFFELLTNEIDFTIEKIKESCSNFSAWHYRSKLIMIYFEIMNIDWNSIDSYKYFQKSDFGYLEKAIYTDPKDQSPWNYLNWIINSLLPVFGLYIIKVEQEDEIYEVRISDMVRIKELINENYISYNKNKENISLTGLTSTIYINLSLLKEKLSSDDKEEINILQNNKSENKTAKNDLISIISKTKSKSTPISYIKNNINLPDIIYNTKDKKLILINHLQGWQLSLLLSQIKFITKLINESEGFLEIALFRKVQFQEKLFYYYSLNNEVEDNKSNNVDNLIKEILIGYEILILKSKRQGLMYKQIMNEFLDLSKLIRDI